jgi:Immunity protein Imm1
MSALLLDDVAVAQLLDAAPGVVVARQLSAGLERPDGAALSIGLGRDHSVLNYMSSPYPPYFTSHDEEADTDGTVVFFYYGHWSEFPADAAVPMADAREAARRFFETGERPDNVAWQMD